MSSPHRDNESGFSDNKPPARSYLYEYIRFKERPNSARPLSPLMGSLFGGTLSKMEASPSSPINYTERSVGDKDLCEFFPRLVRKSTPLSTAGAIGTEPDTLPEPHEGSGDEEEEGQGQSQATGVTSGLEPHGLITDEHELRALGKGVTDEVIETHILCRGHGNPSRP